MVLVNVLGRSIRRICWLCQWRRL